MHVSQIEQEALETALARIELFRSLNQKALSRVAREAAAIQAPRGKVLFQPGDPSDCLHAVVEGQVKLALPGKNGSEKVIALIGSGRAFGQSAMFVDEPHIVSAVTLAPTTLVRVPKSTMLACIRRDPEFALHIVAALSGQLRELIRDIASSALHSGTERTVSFILGELPVALTGEATLTLPARKRIIASRLDLTHEHFSRILHDLSAANLISVQGGTVTVPDVLRLRAFRG